uniref:Apple domain-containing protein n=1 Tax=Meloidogyne hapla TaxID=6305 RepID=A0A1I8BHH3_MELHA
MHSINKYLILISSSIIILPSFIYTNNVTTNNKKISLEERLNLLCSDAPNKQLKIICKQLHRSDIKARTYLEVAALKLKPKCAQECFDLLCMCKYFRGKIKDGICILPNGNHLKKAVRKEYRMLSDEEREKYLFGETGHNQSVINGPYSPWKTLEGNEYITRSVGENGICIKQADIDTIMNNNGILNCLGYSTPKDIWEMWRLKNQNRTEREIQYPPDNDECASDDHYGNATMEPFNVSGNLVNIDALKNLYTDLLYEYAPRQTCDNITDCGSKYLFCDHSHGKPGCLAKVKIGGKCVGFEKEDICMYGYCNNGICVAKENLNSTTSEIKSTTIK